MLEADDVARTTAQVELRERYRTLLGHFRHESGHYFWSLLSVDEKATSLFADLFGDANAEYRVSLDRYYEDGPPADWEQRFEVFHTLPPHPALENIVGVSKERSDSLPVFISEIKIQLEEIDVILAFAPTLETPDQ